MKLSKNQKIIGISVLGLTAAILGYKFLFPKAKGGAANGASDNNGSADGTTDPDDQTGEVITDQQANSIVNQIANEFANYNTDEDVVVQLLTDINIESAKKVVQLYGVKPYRNRWGMTENLSLKQAVQSGLNDEEISRILLSHKDFFKYE